MLTNTSYDTLIKSAKNIMDAIHSIESTKASVTSKYEQLGQSWSDKKYDDLGRIVDECNGALDSVLETLLQGAKGILLLAKSIQEYEDTNLQSGLHAASAQTAAAAASSAQTADPAVTVKLEGKKWAETLSKETQSAIRDYTGTKYRNINAVLRGITHDFDPGNRERAARIHSALQQSSIPSACTVYRGASLEALGAYRNLSDDQLVGLVLIDRGFMSTSLNSGDAFGGEIRLEIHVPEGAQGAYVGYLSECGHYESEVLFDRRQRLEITDVHRDSFGNRIIRANLLL